MFQQCIVSVILFPIYEDKLTIVKEKPHYQNDNRACCTIFIWLLEFQFLYLVHFKSHFTHNAIDIGLVKIGAL